ncbi:hypothetical protein ACFPN7_18200 [Amycolatopsis halotolerans]|uniref:hypothetical protein n=1 Tax=Amycolatopsis halotolerans TaxID=330083 RepID=UPI00361878E3
MTNRLHLRRTDPTDGSEPPPGKNRTSTHLGSLRGAISRMRSAEAVAGQGSRGLFAQWTTTKPHPATKHWARP